jgi:hypothetical protein
MKEYKTLEQILEKEKTRRQEEGMFGIKACKESIIFEEKYFGKSYYQQLEEMVEKANTDIFFNTAMVLACWELINQKEN